MYIKLIIIILFSVHTIKDDYTSDKISENERAKNNMTEVERRKFDGIGPTTKDGMPIILRSVNI